jgi:hypothetical protein
VPNGPRRSTRGEGGRQPMTRSRALLITVIFAAVLALAGCGGQRQLRGSAPPGPPHPAARADRPSAPGQSWSARRNRHTRTTGLQARHAIAQVERDVRSAIREFRASARSPSGVVSAIRSLDRAQELARRVPALSTLVISLGGVARRLKLLASALAVAHLSRLESTDTLLSLEALQQQGDALRPPDYSLRSRR